MDWGNVFSTVGDIASAATAGYNIYSGIKNMNTARDYYDALAGSAEKQDEIATDQWAINKPLMQKQGALSGLELDKAIAMAPGLLSAQYDLYGRSLDQQGKDMNLYDSSRGILSRFFDESEKGLDPTTEMDRAGTAVENAMAGAQGQLARNLTRRGISLGGDQATHMTQQNIISKALGKAVARNEAFQTTADTNYNRLGNAANVRSGMGATVTAPRTPAISLGNPTGALANVSTTQNNIAQAASQAAGTAFNDAAYLLTRNN